MHMYTFTNLLGINSHFTASLFGLVAIIWHVVDYSILLSKYKRGENQRHFQVNSFCPHIPDTQGRKKYDSWFQYFYYSYSVLGNSCLCKTYEIYEHEYILTLARENRLIIITIIILSCQRVVCFCTGKNDHYYLQANGCPMNMFYRMYGCPK